MKDRHIFKYKIPAGAMVLLVLWSCNARYLKKGQMLYTGAEIKIKNDTISKKEKSDLKDGLEKNLTPKPNTSFLGLRPRLWIYNITPEPKKEKGIMNWLHNKIGEKPVLLEQVDREFNKKIIENYSQNKGYFNAKATYDTVSKGKTAKVIYTDKTGPRYLISNVKFNEDSTKINKEIFTIKDQTLLRAGHPFDLDVIKAERDRIDNRLKEKGFYYFHPDNIIVQADSTVTKDHKVELIVKLKDNTPAIAKEQFRIKNVIVFADYNLRDVRQNKYKIPLSLDSLKPYKDFYIVDPKHKFNPKIFDRALYFKPGDVYNRADHNLTLNRLISLGVFKFVKNEFPVSDSLQHKFDAYYLLTPKDFQSLRLETTGHSNSANYVGSEVSLNWLHRNIFKGAEQLKVALNGNFDMQMGGDKNANNLWGAGISAQLSIPRIVAPFRINSSSAFVPRTIAEVSYKFQNRAQWYTLHNFNAYWGYIWKENIRKEHELHLFDATLVYPLKVTPVYDTLMKRNPLLKHVVEKQLTFGPNYSYTYTNTMLPRTNTIYYKGFVELAGTLTGLLSGADAKKGDQKSIFGIPYSQYAKMENDFRFYHKFNTKQSLAARAVFGIAYPYGNSEMIPFSRQFFAGGSNDIRAFRARSLGPGSYYPTDGTAQYYYDEGGDLKLEMNAEYRANLYKFLNVAAFIDAGNIWLINKDPLRPGAEFTKDWMKEIAVGAGVGLRLDFNILLLRMDLAMPLRVPYGDESQRWVIKNANFSDGTWRKNNLMFNIAIGYPF